MPDRGDGGGPRESIEDDRRRVLARAPGHRNGIVFLLTLLLAVFLVAAPDDGWARATALVLLGATLIVAVSTSRGTEATRRWGVAIVAAITLLAVAAILADLGSRTVSAVFGTLATAAIPVVMARGVGRLLRQRGVTVESVSGALVIYLSLGLVVAWIITFISEVSHQPYFTDHGATTLSDRVYFSFTTLTTTGYGDFTPATRLGKSISVIEMVIGQLYLVTVVGILVGRRQTDERSGAGG